MWLPGRVCELLYPARITGSRQAISLPSATGIALAAAAVHKARQVGRTLGKFCTWQMESALIVAFTGRTVLL